MIEDLVSVKRSKRARRVALRLDPVQRVVNLVIPEKMSEVRAFKFAQAHEEWVRETLAKLPAPTPFRNGAEFSIFGDPVTLRITPSPESKRTRIEQYDDSIDVFTNLDDPSNRIKSHLKRLSKIGLADIAQDKASEIHKTIRSVSVRDTKSRWGSCSHSGDLSFSWRLIFAPYIAADYVVAHEVAHLIHMNHSRAFWDLCEALCIDYKGGKSWMKENGNSLMRFGAS